MEELYKSVEMTDEERATWHYVLDIHNPEGYWYSIGLLGDDL